VDYQPFLGTWRLDTSACAYEVGEPPLEGIYRIEEDGEGLLFVAEWVTRAGEAKQVQYRSMPDGRPHPFENPAVLDELITKVSPGPSLDTSSLKGGKVVAFATRVLSADGQAMTVTQSGTTSAGQAFSNVSLYRRVISDQATVQ